MKVILCFVFLAKMYTAPAQVRGDELKIYGHAAWPLGKLNDNFNRGYIAGLSNYIGYTEKSSFSQTLEFTGLDSNGYIFAVALGYRYKSASHFYFQTAPGLAFKSKQLEGKTGFILKSGLGYAIPFGGGFIDILSQLNYMPRPGGGYIWISAGAGFVYPFSLRRNIRSPKKS